MIVLHAIWDAGTPDSAQLHIWAESSHLPISASRPAGRPNAGQKPQKHPFALAQDALREALGELAGSLPARNAHPGALTLSLPSSTKGPLPSPELILDEEVELKATAFKAWHVTTLALDANCAIDLLLALPDNALHGMAFGASLRFWTTAASFAFELIARQCYMPALQAIRQKRETIYRAAWQAVLAPEDAQRMQTLASMMPPICYAFLPPGPKKASLREEMLRHFLNHTIDAFVRHQISATELLHAPNSQKSRTI